MSARAKWSEHIRAWRASGETAAVYCERAGLNRRTLAWWASKLQREQPRSKGASLTPVRTSFVEVTPAAVHAGSFELEVASVIVRVPVDFDAPALDRLLDALEARR